MKLNRVFVNLKKDEIVFLWSRGQRFLPTTVTITPSCFNLLNLHVFSNLQNTLCMYFFLIIELSDFEESVCNLIPSFVLKWLLLSLFKSKNGSPNRFTFMSYSTLMTSVKEKMKYDFLDQEKILYFWHFRTHLFSEATGHTSSSGYVARRWPQLHLFRKISFN